VLPQPGSVLAWAVLLAGRASGQDAPAAEEAPPVLRAGVLGADFRLDGLLDEQSWRDAAVIDGLTQTDPSEGEPSSERTEVRVLADATRLAIGVRCHDSVANEIVARTMERDAPLGDEDRVRVVLDPYLDGRTGYLFVVNPHGARYDALVSRNGESENRSWDAIWEARAVRDENGWSVEILIPLQSLGFRSGSRRWFFNVERRIQRNLEVSRWASPSRNFALTQTSRAGILEGLPEFSHGIGLSVRPAVVLKHGRPDAVTGPDLGFEASLDVTQRLAPELLLSLTYNTDFSETEVDTRQTNLTRFPLFFPEKRTFFLDGADVFEFGLGTGNDVIPFYSRRIGLVGGVPVPLDFGGKLSGRVNGTGMGALGVRTGPEAGVSPAAGMGVVRVKQNILEESSAGFIATVGDPLSRGGAWTAGGDLTYQTSRFLGGLNLLAGVWALGTGRDDLGAGDSAFGGQISLPNDTIEASLGWKRIGDRFDPSLGFVPRMGVWKYSAELEHKWRPADGWLRVVRSGANATLHTDLDGDWESYRFHASAFDVEFESGDEIGVHLVLEGDRPGAAFEVAPGIFIPAGTYQGFRWHPRFETASKRLVSAKGQVDLGEYYDGRLTQAELEVMLNPHPLVTLSGTIEITWGELPAGNFRRELYGGRVRINLTPDVALSSFVQYDTESRDLGIFVRFRWTLTPESDLFLVYTHHWLEQAGTLVRLSYDSAVKAQIAFRF
jgi:hypothetical protein